MNVGESIVTTLETIDEFRVVDAEQMEGCGIQVMDMYWVFDNVVAEVVR
jgi:hypothetical protein